MKIHMVTYMAFFSSIIARVHSECEDGEYTDSRGLCAKCYYYCVTCDNQRFYNCHRECGCLNNYTGDCDFTSCGGCFPGYEYNTNGYCRCSNSYHCCGDTCNICGGPGQCKECQNGLYGPLCEGVCRSGCLKCDNFDSCTECKPGNYGPTCTNSCRNECTKCVGYDNCTECVAGRYGQNCSTSCRSDCVTCTNFNNCNSCLPGKYGSLCENNCRSECTACTNFDSCTECIHGRYGNQCEIPCESGCRLCGLNKYGQYICYECQPGRYGYYCKDGCSERCRDNLCDKSNGHCTRGCIDRFYPALDKRYCNSCYFACTKCSDHNNCSECISGRYGTFCEQKCTGCIDGLCDKETGECTLGCDDYFYLSSGSCMHCPDNCLNCIGSNSCTQCISGKYGTACQDSCKSCKNNTCEIETGVCTNGCIDSYYTDVDNECARCPYTCSSCTSYEECEVCTSRTFWGPNCLYYCNDCIEGCAKDDGCISGCHTRYFQYFNHTKGGFQCNPCPELCDSCSGSEYEDCSDCKPGHWGSYCEFTCEGCRNGDCDRSQGCASGCLDGYYLEIFDGGSHCLSCPENCKTCLQNNSCSDCMAGYFGPVCEYKCSQNHSACIKCAGEDFESFECTECRDGYYPGRNICQPCNDYCFQGGSWPYCNTVTGFCRHGCRDNAFWGRYCENDCSGCRENVCDRTIGCYYGCSNDFYLKIYENEFHCAPCPQHCTNCLNSSYCSSCTPTFYGKSCEYPCITEDEFCTRCTGQDFDSFRCLECQSGYYPGVDTFTCEACSPNCEQVSVPYCNQSTGACYHGCKEGWLGDICDRMKCAVDNCATCDSDDPNSCLSCNEGFFAESDAICKGCPENCVSDTTCDQANGFCLTGCKSGWSGQKCDQRCQSRCAICSQEDKDICSVCQVWFHGENCERSCSVNCSDVAGTQICNKDTGHCLNGCIGGRWGLTCSETCSEGCIDGLCISETGACVKGCKIGTWGIMCLPCSEGCEDGDCDVATGICYKGCKTGFHETLCIPESQTSDQQSDKNDSTVVGLSVGISLLAVVTVIAIATTIYLLKRRRQNTDQANNENTHVAFTQASEVYGGGNVAFQHDKGEDVNYLPIT